LWVDLSSGLRFESPSLAASASRYPIGYIVRVSAKFQVFGVDAERIVALMAHDHISGALSVSDAVCRSVRGERARAAFLVNAHLSVFATLRPLPEQTPGGGLNRVREESAAISL
jgi:hypothetical protein